MAKGLIAGLALGLLLGWLLFAGESVRGARPNGRAELAPRGSAPLEEARRGPAHAAPSAAATREALPPDHPAGLTIRARKDGTRSYEIGGVLLGVRPLEAIDASMVAARAEKNWPEFLACLLELVIHASPDADRRLVAVVGDESLRLHGRTGWLLYERLKRSDVNGVRDAAFARTVLELRDGEELRMNSGFPALVARFGSQENLDWIESLEGKDIEVDSVLAAGAANPEAAKRLRERLLARPRDVNWSARAFVRENPAAAFETALALLSKAGARGEAYRFLGDATQTSSLERARTLLLQLESKRARLESIGAVEAMRRKDLDVTGFEPLLDMPRVVIEERLAGTGGGELVTKAIYAVEYNRAAWTDGNLAALRALADTGNKRAQHAAKVLESIERERTRQPGWEPERG